MQTRTILPPKQLADAFAAYAQTRSEADRNRLVEAHLGLVAYVARKLLAQAPPHVEQADLESWGNLGLLQAVEHFEPDRGLTFANFAITRIRGAIIDEMRHEDWAPRQVRGRSRRWQAGYDDLSVKLGRVPTVQEATAALGAQPETPTPLVGLSSARVSARSSEQDLDLPLTALPGDATSSDRSQDAAGQLEVAALRDRLAAAVAQLPDRMRIVMALHYREEMDLHQIAGLLDCGATLISNIQTDALHLLRQFIGAG